ncbi:hypothetical protein GQ43DRAFT_450107 [Delitschia confertaspora ATCC 74209]|uniref:Zn(2)-C6 fungal-type domain-containing protein n=1 Tax=Delitschia confertaspora ATCC 74209 TaxID=1513339 RepID=A0A9P4MR70_9PLEO|nr:hypothetical protein GQ43DRAFT_450107 [Delitschia confertaspora ATCC 74209]
MAVGIESRVRKVVPAFDHKSLFRPLQGTAMAYDPPLHSAGVGLPVTETSTPHISADPPGYNPSHSAQATTAPPVQAHIHKKRRPSKSKVPPEIRRSSSTPHMRHLALATSGELSPTANKQRNKLGYHRTSVACGHCRRRKIRCLVAQDDPQGRCSNCIRLKKECNFHPVEQTPENQRAQVKDRGQGSLNPSTPSSPHHAAPMTGEHVEEYHPPLSGVPSNAPVSNFGIHPELDVDPSHAPHAADLSQPSSYSYGHPIEAQWTTPAFLTSPSLAENSPSSSGHWRPSPSTATSNYGSESTMSGAQTPATMSSASNVPYHDSHSWNQPAMQPPTRSMSYGNIEGLHQYPNHSGNMHHQEYRNRAPSYHYPACIDTSASMQTAAHGDSGAPPLSAPILASQPYNYQSTWHPYAMQGPDMPTQNQSTSTQWYTEPTPLDQVQEEGVPPALYNHGQIQAYYSGP